MGAAGMIAKFIGKKLGEKAFGIERKSVWFSYEGHNPWEPVLKNVMTFEEKVADLAKEAHKVDPDYLKTLAQQASQRHDLQALKAIYQYAIKFDYGKQFLDMLIRFGQDVKLHHYIGNPFAMIESVVRHLS